MTGTLDINEVFRGGGRSVEYLDQINQASIVMLDETGIVPHPVAASIAKGIAQVIAQQRASPPRHRSPSRSRRWRHAFIGPATCNPAH